jgi:uncharacterized repeat protein (TIGR01451 family)
MQQLTPDFTIASYSAGGAVMNSVSIGCSTVVAVPDFSIYSVLPSSFVAPLQTGMLHFQVVNSNCSDTADAAVSVTFPQDFVPDLTNLLNASVSGNTLTFDIADLTGAQLVTIPFTFPGSTPAGTQISFSATVSHPDDPDTVFNTATGTGEVLNSYDPNEKNADKPTMVDPSVAETFTYKIHFQNDGNMEAFNIAIRDSISANLDLSTFEVVGSSHNVSAMVNPHSREITFSFADIHLAPSSLDLAASQGYVIYRIRENEGLPVGSAIANTAYIYFDFNPPIVTNTTYNVNQTLGMTEQTADAISLFPNPADELIRFSGAAVNAVQIFDLAGKQLLNAPVVNNELSVTSLANGIYQVVIFAPDGIQTQKLAIRK